MAFIFPYIRNVIIPTDFHIFERGWNHQTDSDIFVSHCNIILTFLQHDFSLLFCKYSDNIFSEYYGLMMIDYSDLTITFNGLLMIMKYDDSRF